jgi:hypothetical protein
MRKIIALFFLASACTDPSAEPLPGTEIDIVGTWRVRESDETVIRNDSTFSSFYDAQIPFYPSYSLTFTDATTGIADGKAFTYRKQGNTLLINQDGKSHSWKVSSPQEGKISLKAVREDLQQVVAPISAYQKLDIEITYKKLADIQEDYLPQGYYRPTEEIDYRPDGTFSKRKFTYSDEGYVQQEVWSSGDVAGTENSISVINTTFSHRMMGKKMMFFKHQPYIGTTNQAAPSFTSGYMDLSNSVSSIYEYTPNFPINYEYTYDNEGRLKTKKVKKFPYLEPGSPYELTTFTYEDNTPWSKSFSQYYKDGSLSEMALLQVRTFTELDSRTRIPYIYNEGKVAERNLLPKDISAAVGGTPSTTYSYELDNQKRVKVRKTYTSTGTLSDSTVYVY